MVYAKPGRSVQPSFYPRILSESQYGSFRGLIRRNNRNWRESRLGGCGIFSKTFGLPESSVDCDL